MPQYYEDVYVVDLEIVRGIGIVRMGHGLTSTTHFGKDTFWQAWDASLVSWQCSKTAYP
jgi:hypothetical protein